MCIVNHSQPRLNEEHKSQEANKLALRCKERRELGKQQQLERGIRSNDNDFEWEKTINLHDRQKQAWQRHFGTIGCHDSELILQMKKY